MPLITSWASCHELYVGDLITDSSALKFKFILIINLIKKDLQLYSQIECADECHPQIDHSLTIQTTVEHAESTHAGQWLGHEHVAQSRPKSCTAPTVPRRGRPRPGRLLLPP